MIIEIENNSGEILEDFLAALLQSLERCGSEGESIAKDLAPFDTGNLKNSITHIVNSDELSAVIGTDEEYGVYQELGTGIYAEGGGGRPTPWVYQDAKGNWHYTRGNKAHPFLKPAIADHTQTYKNIFEDNLKKG